MDESRDELPDDVLAALRQGDPVEAIKRLRAASGLGLKDAKQVIDAHLNGEPAGWAPRVGAATPLPDPVMQAIWRGNKIEAIKLLRRHTGLGLKEANDLVDASSAGSASCDPGAEPGAVPRSRGAVWWGVALLACAWLAYLLTQGSP